MLMRTDPFRELDRLTEQVFGTASRPTTMPMEAWREDGEFVVEFDLPGVDPGTIDVDVERNVLTVRADRQTHRPDGAEVIAAERPSGTFGRELILGDALDTGKVTAQYADGVLTLRIPVAEEAKPRKVAVSMTRSNKEIAA
ncbi:Hsp20/alpha crystallin family protein [Sinomonas sp. ASV486]|uniref:Hsp20/alpha crystallin family protein n=1 Tax=Sinomonas sp. ASV486 TaxID=3051170 RepID=UPI0027DB14E4|nr:Hsp20/alpha crystallin family protein [Sinomonas sp. ASV486]MDQ4488865.1 Hsp20/alpha crystallin family protein [Sinomonas sp. ASV486]